MAAFPLDGSDGATLLSHADTAMYSAKGAGKNNIALYSQNKRRYIRFALETMIRAEVLNLNCGSQLKGAGKNISAGGILFESRQCLELGTELQLSIPISQEAPLLVLGTVVRVETFGPEQFDIGVSFLRMAKENEDELSRCLLRQLSNSAEAD